MRLTGRSEAGGAVVVKPWPGLCKGNYQVGP